MSDVLREIQEDLRLERYRTLARRFWSHALAAALLSLASFGGYALWDDARTARQAEEADRYADAVEALEEGREGEAIADLAALARDAEPGYATLARLTEATALAVTGDVPGAVDVYDLLVADEEVADHYRDLARILSAQLLLDQGPASGIRERVGPLAEGTGPWRHLAREIEAHLADRENDLEFARERFQELADDAEASGGVRSRAREMLSRYEEEEEEPEEAAEAETGGTAEAAEETEAAEAETGGTTEAAEEREAAGAEAGGTMEAAETEADVEMEPAGTEAAAETEPAAAEAADAETEEGS